MIILYTGNAKHQVKLIQDNVVDGNIEQRRAVTRKLLFKTTCSYVIQRSSDVIHPIKIFRFSHVISANKEYEIVSKPWALLPICARRSIIGGGGGADIHLFMFTDHNNN